MPDSHVILAAGVSLNTWQCNCACPALSTAQVAPATTWSPGTQFRQRPALVCLPVDGPASEAEYWSLLFASNPANLVLNRMALNIWQAFEQPRHPAPGWEETVEELLRLGALVPA